MTNLEKLRYLRWDMEDLISASDKIRVWTYNDTSDGVVTSRKFVEELQTMVKELKEKYGKP